MRYHYTGIDGVELGRFKLDPFSRGKGQGDPRLYDAKVISSAPESKVKVMFYCSPSDMLYYDDPEAPTNLDGVGHRYFHPPATNGIEAMLGVPRVVVTMPSTATPGEAMHVRWYFWTAWRHMDVLGSTIDLDAEDLVDVIHGLATDVVDVYEPIPFEAWRVPILAPLPVDFTSLGGPARTAALIKRT